MVVHHVKVVRQGGYEAPTKESRYEKLSRALAKKLKVSLDNEGEGVELWTYGSGLSLDEGVHTSIPQFMDYSSENELWKYLYGELRNLQECHDTCTCKEEN